MSKKRIIRRKQKSPGLQSMRPATVPMTRESFGLSSNEKCEILLIGGSAYCSFIRARLSRLGMNSQIAITDSDAHALWAVKHLKPEVMILNVDYQGKTRGMDLAQKLEAANPGTSVILTSSSLDGAANERMLRTIAWSMGSSWSLVTRRKTDNGDPLGLAVVTAKQGVGWIDFPVRKLLERWRGGKPLDSGSLEEAIAA